MVVTSGVGNEPGPFSQARERARTHNTHTHTLTHRAMHTRAHGPLSSDTLEGKVKLKASEQRERSERRPRRAAPHRAP